MSFRHHNPIVPAALSTAIVFHAQAEPVTEINSDISDLAERMTDLMEEANGIGLAAPQVGVSLRIIVVSITGKRQDAKVLINPVLSDLQGVSEMEEGCLSIPGVHANVKRAASCSVEAQDIDGNLVTHFQA